MLQPGEVAVGDEVTVKLLGLVQHRELMCALGLPGVGRSKAHIFGCGDDQKSGYAQPR